MRVATWNINSINVREDRVLGFLEQVRPDVLCLQEIKGTEDVFPYLAIEAAGYHSVVYGQKAYNGVALVTREPASDVIVGMGPSDTDPQARLISAVVGGVRVFSAYFPNGEIVGSEKYEYKLAWIRDLRDWLSNAFDPSTPLVLAGDFNVAPRDADAENPDRWRPTVLCHTSARNALAKLREFGLIDVFERLNPQGGIYTWWDYQRLAFPKNDGLRIDHVYATVALGRRGKRAWVERDHRKKLDFESKPSDHAPVVVDFDV